MPGRQALGTRMLLGALVRNQIIAAVAVLTWMLAVQQIVIPAFPAIGRWMPGGATNAHLQLGPAIDLQGRPLSKAEAGLVLPGYTPREFSSHFS